MWRCGCAILVRFSLINGSYLHTKSHPIFTPKTSRQQKAVQSEATRNMGIDHCTWCNSQASRFCIHLPPMTVRDWMIFSWLPMKCLQMPQKMPAWSLRAMSTHHPLNYPFYSTYGNLMTCEVFFEYCRHVLGYHVPLSHTLRSYMLDLLNGPGNNWNGNSLHGQEA